MKYPKQYIYRYVHISTVFIVLLILLFNNKIYANDNRETDYIKDANGWVNVDGVNYWYEDGYRQGYDKSDSSYRGKEIYDDSTNSWYWLDNVIKGAVAKSKDVYQESLAGDWGDVLCADGTRTGKWVRYDSEGKMIKGWQVTSEGTYYFDKTYGTMAKGYCTVDGVEYYFRPLNGVLIKTVATGLKNYTGWKLVEGKDIWYENGVRQGYSLDSSYRGKEIFDPLNNAWYWLDNVKQGEKAVSKDVYQETAAGQWGLKVDDKGNRIGKWVRYDEYGHMIKGWQTTSSGKFYFDLTYGTMAKGDVYIDGEKHHFDEVTGIMTPEIAYVFVGDSRFYQMNELVDIKSYGSNFYVLAEAGVGFDYLNGHVTRELATLRANHPEYKKIIVISNLGINDLKSLPSYARKYDSMIKEGYEVNFVSVTQVEANQYISNGTINNFNSGIHDVDGIKYTDAYKYLNKRGYKTSDKLHYLDDVYIDLFKFIFDSICLE